MVDADASGHVELARRGKKQPALTTTKYRAALVRACATRVERVAHGLTLSNRRWPLNEPKSGGPSPRS
jgi:hypothetical protein